MWNCQKQIGTQLKKLLGKYTTWNQLLLLLKSHLETALAVPVSASFSWLQNALETEFHWQEEEKNKIYLQNHASPNIYYLTSLDNSGC